MSLYSSILRPALFQLDAEKAHELAMSMLSKGFLRAREFADPRLRVSTLGTSFPNPLGLAAGFDKNATVLNHWHLLGFGHVECGTITYHAQPGNPRPRLFRLPEERALINRMGFNNIGASAAATNLAASKAQIPVGVNIGKSKITDLSKAAQDYQESFRLLHSFGAYFAINVSSPNTPGLRTLQEKGPLLEIISALREVDAEKPLLVKVAPDLELSALDDLVDVAVSAKLQGIIATNTTISRPGLVNPPDETGGLSGAPLQELSDRFLSHLYKNCPKDMVLIGVGGIMNGEDLYRKLRLGATLCQIYTGWIYGGLHMIPETLRDLCGLMDRDGVKDLAEIRGTLTV